MSRMTCPFPKAKTAVHLFDHLIKPILLYGCEIWGPVNIKLLQNTSQNLDFWKQLQMEFLLEHTFHNTPSAYEKLHLKYCKQILGINQNIHPWCIWYNMVIWDDFHSTLILSSDVKHLDIIWQILNIIFIQNSKFQNSYGCPVCSLIVSWMFDILVVVSNIV